MPELPDLEVLKDAINARYRGNLITGVDLRRPEFLKTRYFPPEVFKNSVLSSVSRRGKILIFTAQNGFKLVFHPMLRGWILDRAEDYVLKFSFSNGSDIFILEMENAGLMQLFIVKKPENLRILKSLGPEPLDDGFNTEYLKSIVRNSKDRIKKLITTQKVVAGIGNAYADEILWKAGINPFRKANTLKDQEIERLTDSTKEVLKEAIKVLKNISENGIPPFEYRDHMKIHRRDGKPCPRCGTPIEVKFEGERGTWWCPVCQP